VREFRDMKRPARARRLASGHYSTGRAPFKYVDGWILTDS